MTYATRTRNERSIDLAKFRLFNEDKGVYCEVVYTKHFACRREMDRVFKLSTFIYGERGNRFFENGDAEFDKTNISPARANNQSTRERDFNAVDLDDMFNGFYCHIKNGSRYAFVTLRIIGNPYIFNKYGICFLKAGESRHGFTRKILISSTADGNELTSEFDRVENPAAFMKYYTIKRIYRDALALGLERGESRKISKPERLHENETILNVYDMAVNRGIGKSSEIIYYFLRKFNSGSRRLVWIVSHNEKAEDFDNYLNVMGKQLNSVVLSAFGITTDDALDVWNKPTRQKKIFADAARHISLKRKFEVGEGREDFVAKIIVSSTEKGRPRIMRAMRIFDPKVFDMPRDVISDETSRAIAAGRKHSACIVFFTKAANRRLKYA